MSDSDNNAVLEERTKSHHRRIDIIERCGAKKTDLDPMREKVDSLEKNQRWFVAALITTMAKLVFDFFREGGS